MIPERACQPIIFIVILYLGAVGNGGFRENHILLIIVVNNYLSICDGGIFNRRIGIGPKIGTGFRNLPISFL